MPHARVAAGAGRGLIAASHGVLGHLRREEGQHLGGRHALRGVRRRQESAGSARETKSAESFRLIAG